MHIPFALHKTQDMQKSSHQQNLSATLRSAIALKPSTLLHFHEMLVQQKYRLLFSPKRVRLPGPKGPTKELIDAVVGMKRRNRT